LIGLIGVITMIFVWPAVYDEPPIRGGDPEVVFFGRWLLFGYYAAWAGAVVGLLGQWAAILVFRQRTALLAVAGAALVATILAGCGDNGRPPIAFISDRDGNPEVYVLQGKAGEARRLASTPDDREMSPAISPDGKQVAFLSTLSSGETGLWVVAIDGRDPRRIGGPPGKRLSFAWSPDSKRIAYEVATPGRGTDIYVSDLDGRKTIAVTSGPGTARLGGWSRDGQWLVYSISEGPRQGIIRKNPDGVNEIRLSERADVGPKWSPDGTRVAFMSKRDSADYDIYVVDINGNREQNVTSAGGNDTDFDWSPDSRRIVFISDRHGNPEVYIQTIGRQEAVRLTTNNANEAGPRWSKDGREILFVSDADGDYDLYVMRPDGTRQERLTLNSADDTSASW
jgi:TolB protein